MAWQKTVLNVKNLSTPYMVHTILNKCSDSGMEVSAERPTDQPTDPQTDQQMDTTAWKKSKKRMIICSLFEGIEQKYLSISKVFPYISFQMMGAFR